MKQQSNISDSLREPANDKIKQKFNNPSSSTEYNSDELKQLFAEFHKTSDDVKKYIDNIAQKMGLSIQSMLDFIENPKNFTSHAEWQKIQQKRQFLRESFLDPKKALLNQKSIIDGLLSNNDMSEEVTPHPTTVRKKNVLNRRNWLSMH